MDVLILAAGLGSRLSSYTHNIIPKYLINIDNNTGLYYIINYWNKYANNIYLVIHSKFNLITQFYINSILHEYIDKIKIINYNNSDGTAYTLNYILNNELNKYEINNLLITWCDLYPNEPINFKSINKKTGSNNIHVFTNGNKCRYNLNEKNEIIYSDGNIIGIYYFQNYKIFNLDKSSINNDIVIYLDKIGNIYNYPINNIIDYGDEEKLISILNKNIKTEFNCRYFNSIQLIDNNKLLKKSINDNGNKIIKNEIEWYKYLGKTFFCNYIPKIYSFYEFGFLMEYKINYIPLYKFLNIYEKNINNYDLIEYNEKSIKEAEYNIIKISILKNIINKINILHKIERKKESKIIFFNNLKIEIYDKVINRKNKIQHLLDYFEEINIINGIKIDSFEEVLDKCKNILIQYYEAIDKYEYSIILGDSNFSNILINPDNIEDLIFIDPRGYFGESNIFGCPEYDYSKILYALSGYDNFNNNYFNIKKIDLENKSLDFEIKPFFIDNKIINNYFNKVHQAYLVIIWLSLGDYCKNDIWKCLASYYYGLYLGTKL